MATEFDSNALMVEARLREEALDVMPADEDLAVTADEHSLLGMAELMLKAPEHVDRLARQSELQQGLVFRFLAIALCSFSLFAGVLVLLLDNVPQEAVPGILATRWQVCLGAGVSLWLAYAVGLVAASGICLPSFYFFGLLAGIRASWLQVTTHVLRGKGATAILLLGLMPIYVSVVLGMIVFHAPNETLRAALWVGLVLPFVAGLWGMRAIYHAFLSLADTLPLEEQCRRTCFLRRLTVAWSSVYALVSPVMIWKVWMVLSERM
jgi:hypothetical protein